MNCLLATLGSRGDIEPFALLAEALADRGHAVTLAVDRGYRALPSVARLLPGVSVTELGALDERSLVDTVARAVTAATPAERSRAGYHGFIGHRRDALVRRMTELAEDRDLVVVNEALAWQRDGRILWTAPVAVLWYTPCPAEDFRRLLGVPCLRLAALPAFAAPSDADVRSGVTFTGFWHRSRVTPLPDLVTSFLAAGPPPVFLTMGSMSGFDGGALATSVVAGARACGLRVIVQRGWGRLETPMGDDVLVVDELDYSTLFPRCAAVFVHGGTGTIGLALAARRPIAVIPLVEDQHAWARVLAASPFGLGTLDAHAPSEAEVARLLSRLPTAIGGEFTGSDDGSAGLDVACAAIEAYAAAP